MGWKEGGKKKIWLQSFHLFSTISISLLLPLSYLVLARLASARYLVFFACELPTSSFLSSFFLCTNPNILCALVSVVGLNALIHALMDQVSPTDRHPGLTFYPRVHEACFFVGALQVCVGLGIEGTREAGLKEVMFELGGNKGMLTKVVMLVGMHETMVCWCRTMVRPVADTGVVGGEEESSQWAERTALGLSFGGLWWWKLRHEVDALAAVVEIKRHMMIRVGLSDLLGWWLYYLTLIVGISTIAKGMMKVNNQKEYLVYSPIKLSTF
ncbi:hypothetical protein Cgig2_032682 [Carnegiea gigantea]|uniref:Uncharacterized protein n=1 Tax=Carnegiea gigantea TaxID=171969 RepID=A0A9Q1KIA6_9CARY|nr:hypothetical protein Cgig2_032682 [Carnegiea gigantea]